MMKLTNETLIQILKVHSPIKARKIADMLSRDFGRVERKEVNSLLYRMKAKSITVINDKYEWSLKQESGKGSSKSTKSIKLDESPKIEPEICFSEDQERIIKFDLSGNLLVRGQAGSGKTTVLTARAGRCLSLTSRGSLLFLTYNAALCSYVKKIFKTVKSRKELNVETFHQWTSASAKKMGYKIKSWVNQTERQEQLTDIIENAKRIKGTHRLFDIKNNKEILSWWGEEISWLFGQGLKSLDEYLLAERIGRGTAIRVSRVDREFVWWVFDQYKDWLHNNQVEDYDNPSGLIEKGLELTGGNIPEELRYDHVFVDEVQDFDKSWLLSLAKVPRISLSLAGDLAQKIYKRNFTWKSAGIQIQAHRSCKLEKSYRTTRQIMEIALVLAEKSNFHNSEDYVEPTIPTRNGEKVVRIFRNGIRSAYDDGYKYIAKKYKRIRKSSVAIALPFSRQIYPAQQQIAKLGLSVNRAKGAMLGNLENGIVVTTYHQLKGLEFDYVVLMGLDDQNIPGRFLDRVPEEDILEEEQVLCRLVYMAMTRAKKSLTLVGGKPFCRFFEAVPDHLFEDK